MKIMKRTALSTTQLILVSFLAVILLGSILLTLPISSATGEPVAYVDALFTATTATCVTGLVTLPTFSAWSVFGQVVILVLIQMGGLGIITVMTGLMVAVNRKIGLRDSQLIQDAFNLNTLSGMAAFVRKVILGTLVVETVGALGYMTVFVPQFGAKGIWISVFNAVSAFCNAGIDIIGANSLCDYATHPVVNAVTSALIFLSGIGFIVWWDVLRVLKNWKNQKLKCFSGLTLHSKLALSATLVLLVGGGLLILLLEWDNPLTLGPLSVADKLQVAFFQSVTTRTAGFATVPQENLTNASAFVCLLLMFVGGSPVGTAGGIKTVTVVVLAATTLATVRGKSEVTICHRRIPQQTVAKAVAVTCMSLAIWMLSTVLLAACTQASMLDILYETVSAAATVGLTRNLTSTLGLLGKMIIIATMYFGRVGPISLAFAFKTRKEAVNLIKDPTEDISVG